MAIHGHGYTHAHKHLGTLLYQTLRMIVDINLTHYIDTMLRPTAN